MISDDEQIKHYDKSKRSFEIKCQNDCTISNNIKKYRDWCDDENHVITHFGAHPKILPHRPILFDNIQ